MRAQKVHPVFADGPIVSAAIGTNKYDWLSEEYSFLFHSAAASAAAPGVWDVSCTYDWASESLTVTSHVAHFPRFHFPCLLLLLLKLFIFRPTTSRNGQALQSQ